MITTFTKLPIRSQLTSILMLLLVLVFSASGWLNYRGASDALQDTAEAGLNTQLQIAQQLLQTQFQALEMMAGNLSAVFQTYMQDGLKVEAHSVNVNGQPVAALSIGGQVVNNDFTIPDRFTSATGASATIFVRDGDDFMRASTSLRKEDGSRAYGTWLGKNHPGYQMLINGQRYVGYAELFGKSYVTEYRPVIDTQGNTIAILYVGADISAVVQKTFADLAALKIGETGYFYVTDHLGNVLMHPVLEKQTAITRYADSAGGKPFADLLSAESGQVRYMAADQSGEAASRLIEYRKVAGWNWYLLGGTFDNEFTFASWKVAETTLWIALTGIAVIALLGRFILQKALGALSGLSTTLEKIGLGQICQVDVSTVASSRNEVHCMAGSVQLMANSMSNLIYGVRDSVNSVDGSSQQITQLATQQRVIADEVKDQCLQMASAAEQLSNSFSDVAIRVEASANEAVNVNQASKQVSDKVNVLHKASNNMQNQLVEASRSVEALNVSAENIGKVVDIISGIAEKTNLLALNAAIEAARAGDQGRGFAVVADEVRQLASLTQKSTANIISLVASLQSDASRAVDQVIAVQDCAVDSESQAAEADEALYRLSSSISAIAEQLTSVAAAVEQQNQVTNSLTEMQQGLLEKATKSAEDASFVSHSAEGLAKVAQGLNQSVSVFS